MDSLEISAKTVEEAVQLGLEQLGVSREEAEITVVREGKSGLLGMGTEEALVRIKPLEVQLGQAFDIIEVAREVLEKLLDLMDLDTSILPQTQPEVGNTEDTPLVAFNIRGDDLGLLIGRRGQTLAGLQYIVRLIVGHQTQVWAPLIVDVEDYKQRRYQSLRTLAHNIAEQVRANGTSFNLEPMPAYERRIIHLTLADNPDISTQSIGEGEARRVVVESSS